MGAQIYYTTDGSTPVPGTSPLYTGAFNVSASTTVKAIAAAPFYSNSAVATSFIQYDPAAAGVSRTGLQAWYKADNTVTTSGSNVTQWADVSGNAKNAFQNNSINRPTLVSSGPNGLPTINFTPGANGQFLQIPAGFSDFTAGTSMFIVTKPTAVNIVGARFLDLGTGSSADSLGLNAISNTADQFFVINGSTVHTANGNMTLNQYQLLETVQGASSAFVYTNGVLAPGMPVSVQNPTNTNRTSNFIGQYTGGGYYVQGEIAEILIYNRSLTATERSNVENYLMTRYALGVKAPVITVDSPSTAIYTTPKTISISAAPGAQIFYTLNGTTPSATSTSSILYTGPFVVAKPTTIKAIAVQSFGTSAVSTLTLLIDLNADAVMQPGPFTWLRSDMGVGISSGSSVNSWLDVTGNGRTAGSSGAAQPTLVNNAINGLPAVSFNGGNSYMQFPSTDANFSTGVSIFVVANCNSVNQAGDRFIEFSTGSGTNAIALYANSSTSDAYFTSVGASGSGVAGNMTTNEYQLLEAMQDGAGWVGMYRNGVFGPAAAQLPLPPHPINRNVNYVGQYSGGGFFLQGQTAEIIVFNKALSPGQRAAIEGYLLNKYQFSLQKPAAPIISVPTSTLGGPTQVAIAAQPGATIYFTTDGSQPSTASPVYQGPVNVYFTQTLKTIAVRNGIQSAVSSATYTLNSTQWPTPDAFDPTQLQIQLQQPTNGVLQ